MSGNFYEFSTSDVEGMLRRVAETLHALRGQPGNDFFAFERGPGLSCTARVATSGPLLLQFDYVPGWLDADAYAPCFEAPTVAEQRVRRRQLMAGQKTVTLCVSFGDALTEGIPEWPKHLLQALRINERRRIDPAQPVSLPFSEEPWHPQVLEKWIKRESFWWRVLRLNPCKQAIEDIVFLLALTLLQEQMIPEHAVDTLYPRLTDYLSQQGWGCSDPSTARLLLDSLQHHFIEPQRWGNLQSYIKKCLYWEGRQERPRVFRTRREGAEAPPGIFPVDEAIRQFQEEGLEAKRSTLYRWAQQWASQGQTYAFLDEEGRRWLTNAGVAKAREELQWKTVTNYQRVKQKKDPATARQFTYRYRRKGSTPQEAMKAPLTGDNT